MNLTFDEIITQLESFVVEVKRQCLNNGKDVSFLNNVTLRLALHQMDHGPIRYDNNDPRWPALHQFIKDGQLRLCHDGTVLFGTKILDAGDLK